MHLVQLIGDFCARLERGDLTFPSFLSSTVRQIAGVVECSRCAIWVFEDSSQGRRLRCLAMYDRGSRLLVRAPDETGASVSAYFEALRLDGHIGADHVQSHEATRALFSKRATEVKSLMGMPLSVNGVTYGTLVCTELGAHRSWTRAELSQFGSVANKVSLTISNATRHATLTQPAPLSAL
jgi:GAF domain-containing protein